MQSIIYLKLDDIKPYANNPRDNEKAVDKVAKSIKDFGFKNPIIVDKDHIIIAGHTRLKASYQLGLKEAPVIVADDLTEDQANALRLVDNKTNEYASWNFDKLEEELLKIDYDFSSFDFNFDDPTPEPKEREDLSEEVNELFQVIVECESELDQQELFERLTGEGLKCRVLTL